MKGLGVKLKNRPFPGIHISATKTLNILEPASPFYNGEKVRIHGSESSRARWPGKILHEAVEGQTYGEGSPVLRSPFRAARR